MICLSCTIQLTILNKESKKTLASASTHKHKTNSYQSGLTTVTLQIVLKNSSFILSSNITFCNNAINTICLSRLPQLLGFVSSASEELPHLATKDDGHALLLRAFGGSVIIIADQE